MIQQTITLPESRKSGGMPLLSAFQRRRSVRSLGGVRHQSSGGGDRTAPYWRHVMVIELYLSMADRVWRYEPQTHALMPCVPADIRRDTGMQDFVARAPLELLYVAHGERMDVPAEERRLYASVDAAFIGQNVYLFCASEGVGSVFRGAFDQTELASLLQLGDQQFVTFVQTVGYSRD